jgi:hypothetical protein
VKGPHASLAVRLSQRDPDKKWLLGERLPYVLLTGGQCVFVGVAMHAADVCCLQELQHAA